MQHNKIIEYNVLNTPWPIPDNSVDCCVTSPPYWALRNYGVEGQIGMEQTPALYVQALVKVFEEVRRVLKQEGTCWLNLGDTYFGGKGNNGASKAYSENHDFINKAALINTIPGTARPNDLPIDGLKPKDLIGIPWMVAFALRDAGWYLRQDIIWRKPNPMPQSVNDRCTSAHEYIFLLSKASKYYYDADAIKTKSTRAGEKSYHDWENPKYAAIVDERWKDQFDGREWGGGGVANKRSVWSVPTNGLKDAHFATFPEELITPCILAGCPKGGLIIDPFMGAGTTGLVAMSHGRNFIGLELNPEYIRIANKRLKQKFGMFYNP